MSRSDAREKAFIFLFQLTFQPEPLEQQMPVFLEAQPVPERDFDYFQELVCGVQAHRPELDRMFGPWLVKWAMDRLPRIDLTILRIATYEMRYVKEVPLKVAISEAVLLAKKYSSDESRAYINAVLGNISRHGLAADSGASEHD